MEQATTIDPDTGCSHGLHLSEIDRIILGLGGFMISIATFFLIVGFIKYEKLRKQPGDLIMGIAVSDFILSWHWMIQAIFSEQSDNETYCAINGAIGVFVGATQMFYNFAFSLYLILSLKNALKQSSIPKKSFHVISLGFSLIFVIYLIHASKIGKTLAGTCSLKFTCHPGQESLWGPLVVFLYAAISYYAYRFVNKNAPKCGKANAKKIAFLLYYLKYIAISTILYSIIAASTILSDMFVDLENPDNTDWLLTITHAAKVCSPLVLTVIRYNDPLIKGTMTKAILFWRQSSQDGTPKASKVQFASISGESGEEGMGMRTSSGFIRAESLAKDFIFNQLSTNRKLEITYTLLSSVLYAYNYQMNEIANNNNAEVPHERKAKNPYKHERVHRIEEETVFGELGYIKEQLEGSNSNILGGTFKVYAPQIFCQLLEKDQSFINIEKSLDFKENRTQIEAASGADGGRSGEFFFFSKDKKLIIKTTTDEQMKVLVSMLKEYDYHFQEFPDSLISKIYGAYTYENSELGIKFNIILMKNVCGFSSEFVSRVYDLKGSTYQREVLKNTQVDDRSLLKDQVLKDLDFEKYEGKLYIPKDIREYFIKQIKADALFFRKVKVIDYSFVVFYVDKKRWREDHPDHEDFTERNPYGSIANTNEPGVYYNMGIIDYLQPYNFKKMLEKYAKRLQNLNTHLDTSIQDPTFYSTRFYESLKAHVVQD